MCELKPLTGAAEFVRGVSGVALGGVEVLLLGLAKVGAGAEQLGDEYVPAGVRRHALALGDAGGAGVGFAVAVAR